MLNWKIVPVSLNTDQKINDGWDRSSIRIMAKFVLNWVISNWAVWFAHWSSPFPYFYHFDTYEWTWIIEEDNCYTNCDSQKPDKSKILRNLKVKECSLVYFSLSPATNEPIEIIFKTIKMIVPSLSYVDPAGGERRNFAKRKLFRQRHIPLLSLLMEHFA